jgi:hypothetical protein
MDDKTRSENLRRNGDRRASGAVAQLGERLNGIQEVEGSTPFSSTRPVVFFLSAAQELTDRFRLW